LEALLQRSLGDAPLSSALSDVLITSYDVYKHEPFFFKSFAPRPRHGTARADAGPPAASSEYLMRVVGRATSAAPTYFEPEHVPANPPE
jgi:patatin-like phospholipase/acyl hydrolase